MQRMQELRREEVWGGGGWGHEWRLAARGMCMCEHTCYDVNVYMCMHVTTEQPAGRGANSSLLGQHPRPGAKI